MNGSLTLLFVSLLGLFGFGFTACSDDCSGNRICVNDVCQCNGNFLGLDCSIPAFKTDLSVGQQLSLLYAVDSNYLYLKFTSPENYWIGFGVGASETDGMTGGDIMTVNDTVCQDRYATGQSTPLLDSHQDCEFLSSNRENNGDTRVVWVRRKLNTSDTLQDNVILPGETTVTWALLSEPEKQHSPQLRNKLRINFFTGVVVTYASLNQLKLIAFLVGFFVAAIGAACIGHGRTSSRMRISQWCLHKRLGWYFCCCDCFQCCYNADTYSYLTSPLLTHRHSASAKLRKNIDRLTYDCIPTIASLTLGEVAIIVIYFGSLVVYLLLARSNYDAAKRDYIYIFGQLSAIHLTFTLMLPTRNSLWLLVFGISYERLLKYHRWVARLTYCFMTVHGCIMYKMHGSAITATTTTPSGQGNLYGLLAYITFTVVVISTYEIVRRKNFDLFLAMHALVWVGVAFAMVHSTAFLTFVWLPLLLLISDYILRWKRTRQVKLISVKKFEYASSNSDSVVRLEFETETDFHYRAGDFVFLNISSVDKWSDHPFTISSSPSRDGPRRFTIHMMNMGPKEWTGRVELTLSSVLPSLPSVINYKIQGPYGNLSVNAFENYPIVVLAAGGVGVTPLMSILSEIHYRYTNGQSKHLVEVHFIWVSSSRTPFTSWFYETLQIIKNNNDKNVFQFHFYSTDRRGDGGGRRVGDENKSQEKSGHVKLIVEEQVRGGENEGGKNSQNDQPLDIPVSKGRPDYRHIFGMVKNSVKAKNFSSHDVAVLCCGPIPLINRVMHAAQFYQFHLHRETFFF